jgi:hypothetical protein
MSAKTPGIGYWTNTKLPNTKLPLAIQEPARRFSDFEGDVLWLNMEANAAWNFVTNVKNQSDLAQVQNLTLNYFPFLTDVHALS